MNLPSLQGVHVLVVGDLMLDRYWIGPAERVSQEAPVPVVRVERVEEHPGGAANVALNVASLGARCTLIGYVGKDDAAEALVDRLTAAGVACDLVVVDGWSTVVKLRVVSQNQQLIRTDFESALIPGEDHRALLREKVIARLLDASAMVLQDYDKGVIEDPETLIGSAIAAGVPVVVDPKRKPFARYAGAAILKPNAKELEAALGSWDDDTDLVSLSAAACRTHRLGAMVITRGAGGAGMRTAVPRWRTWRAGWWWPRRERRRSRGPSLRLRWPGVIGWTAVLCAGRSWRTRSLRRERPASGSSSPTAASTSFTRATSRIWRKPGRWAIAWWWPSTTMTRWRV
jgi:rfaE bifunctional protein kinase chain/domain